MTNEELPEKVKIAMAIADRFGVTLLFCGFICWLLFIKVQKVIDMLVVIDKNIAVNNEGAKSERGLIKEKLQDIKPKSGG